MAEPQVKRGESDGASEVLRVEGISKTFAGRRVLTDASLRVTAGSAVGLVGQNGSGKSTLIKILSGVYTPDRGGRIAVAGEDLDLPVSGAEAARHGMAFVHQDLGLFEDGSLLENMRVGRYRTGLGWRIRWQSERRACSRALATVGLDLSPETPLRSLSQIDRALVAIARAVDSVKGEGASAVLVLDEPTSYLPRDGVERLFAAVRDLQRDGLGVVFVSHRIEEVLALCDQVVVLRDGKVVADRPTRGCDGDALVATMLGRTMESFYPEHEETAGEVVLSAKGVAGSGIHGLDLEVRRGEIFGVTGLLGMGQERLLYLLTGASPSTGTLEVEGRSAELAKLSPRAARALGVCLLPGDRLRSSGVQLASAQENVTLATLDRFTRLGQIRHRRERAAAVRLIEEFDVRPPAPNQQLRAFSGGNQQKLLLAKWLSADPVALLLHEPTQGVDVGAKQQIFRQLRAAADAGVAIIIATTEYEDLASLCDRVLVLRDGRRAAELAGSTLTDERLVEECYREGVTV